MVSETERIRAGQTGTAVARLRAEQRDAELLEAIKHVLDRHPHYGYRRVAALLRLRGVNAPTGSVRRLVRDLPSGTWPGWRANG